MSLPLTRNTTYAPGQIVKSLDINDIQDAIIDHEARLAPLATPRERAAPLTYRGTDYSAAVDSFSLVVSGPGGGSASAAEYFITARVGERILSIEIDVTTETLVANADLVLTRHHTGGATDIATLSISGTGTHTIAAINHVVLADNSYVIRVEAPNTTGILGVDLARYFTDDDL